MRIAIVSHRLWYSILSSNNRLDLFKYKWQGPALRARSGALNIRKIRKFAHKQRNKQANKQTENRQRIQKLRPLYSSVVRRGSGPILHHIDPILSLAWPPTLWKVIDCYQPDPNSKQVYSGGWLWPVLWGNCGHY